MAFKTLEEKNMIESFMTIWTSSVCSNSVLKEIVSFYESS